MFGRKRIADLESEIDFLKGRVERWERSYDSLEDSHVKLGILNGKQAREIVHTNRKLVLAERAANTVIDANGELVRLHAKDWLEIRELKADIAEQVRVNRAYAGEIGSLCERLERHHEQDMKHVVEGIFGPKEALPDPDPVPTEETNRGYGPEYLKLQRQVKRLKARVKKLTSDNKAMAAEILHNRNSM